MGVIDLLPPEQRSDAGLNKSLVFPLGLLVLVSLLLGIHLRLDGMVVQRQETIAELSAEVATLAYVREERELMDKLSTEVAAVASELERRVAWSEYVDELASRLPDGVVVRDLGMENRQLVVSLSASSVSQVAEFIVNVTSSPLFDQPSVGQITIGIEVVEFQATVNLVRGQ